MNQRALRPILVALLAVTALALAGCIVAYDEPPSQYPAPRPAPPPPPPPPPPRSAAVDIGFFYDALDPYGDWLRIDSLGWVWAPNGVDPFWRPYTVGRWVWTDWGWTWASREPWGWAAYHYGRWERTNRYGWVWIPDTVWGPAWVAWRYGGGAVGWAPLPPQVRFRAEFGLDWGGASIDVVIRPDWWCFVDPMRFDGPDIAPWAYPVGRNVTLIRTTRDATRVRVVDRRIVNDGIGREDISRYTRRAIPVRRVVDAPRAGERGAEVAGEEVRVYRPDVREGRPGVEPRRGRRVPAVEEAPTPETRPAPERRPVVRPGQREEPKPAPVPRAGDRREATRPESPVEAGADREWDRRWLEDWRKLQRERQRTEPKAPAAAKPDANQDLERIRDENREAAENARREQLAARERAKRRAERAAPPKVEKKEEKGEDRKER